MAAHIKVLLLPFQKGIGEISALQLQNYFGPTFVNLATFVSHFSINTF